MLQDSMRIYSKMPKKILYVTSVASHWGSEQSLLILLKHLSKRHYSPFLLTVSGSLQQELEQNRIPYKVFLSHTLTRKHMTEFIRLVCQLAWFIKKNKFALVHSNDIHAAQYTAVAARLARVPSILHIRNIGLEDWFGWKNAAIFKLATKTIAISQETKTSLLKVGVSPSKIELIPNAVDLDRFNEAVSGEVFRQEVGATNAEFLIGVVGRIVPHKGQDFFIQSIPDILDLFPNSRFVIIGADTTVDNHFSNSLQNLITQFDLKTKVHFSGFKEDVPEVMKALDILVVPSLCESFGRVLIEAMATKTPVVATTVGGIPDIVEDEINGMLVPVKDPKAISQAVIRLLSDEELYQAISKNGRMKVEKSFSLPTHVSKIEKLYQSLI